MTNNIVIARLDRAIHALFKHSTVMTAQIEDIQDILAIASTWHQAGEAVALATVTETWGSSPCPAGSRMAVTVSGKMAGSVSGGCIEAAVAAAALDSLKSGKPSLLEFGVTNEMAWEVGLPCGGRIKIFVEPLA